jgi:hypothetical protein
MSRKKKIEKEVEKTLQCFEQAEKLADNPFFYTRVKARIEGRKAPARKNVWQFGWSVLKPAFLILIVALNILTVTIYFTSNQSLTSDQDQLLQAFAQEFALDQSSYNPNLLINE